MKQYINQKQLDDLPDKGKERLEKWWYEHDCDKLPPGLRIGTDEYASASVYTELPLLSIGQMIEFLDEARVARVMHGGGHDYGIVKDELCDALWTACKEVLNAK